MAQRTYLIFGDIENKLDVLCVECTKCARKGRYSVRKLIEKHGRKANMMKPQGKHDEMEGAPKVTANFSWGFWRDSLLL
jgi:hypothetical protein